MEDKLKQLREERVQRFENFHKRNTTPEQHKEFMDSLPTTPKFHGRVEMTREQFLIEDEKWFDDLLYREVEFMIADMRRLRRYMKDKGF